MSPIAEAAAANGLTILATLAIEKLNHKYSLSLRMRRALSRADKSTPEDTLLRDLQHAFGTHGTLTQVTNRSLLDIANSGLLEHLVPLFGSDVDPSDALQLISYIHLSRGSTDASASSKFAKDLATCLQVTARHRPSLAKSQRACRPSLAWGKRGRAKLARIYHRPISFDNC